MINKPSLRVFFISPNGIDHPPHVYYTFGYVVMLCCEDSTTCSVFRRARRARRYKTCLFTGTGGLTHAQSAISNQQSAISNQQSAISNQQSAISNQQSAISNQQSAISNQQSAISNQQSAISNQQSAISNPLITLPHWSRPSAVARPGHSLRSLLG